MLIIAGAIEIWKSSNIYRLPLFDTIQYNRVVLAVWVEGGLKAAKEPTRKFRQVHPEMIAVCHMRVDAQHSRCSNSATSLMLVSVTRFSSLEPSINMSLA